MANKNAPNIRDLVESALKERLGVFLKTDLSNLTLAAHVTLLNSIQKDLTDSESFQKKLADAVQERLSKQRKASILSIFKIFFSVIGVLITLLLSAAQVFDPLKLWLRQLFVWVL